MSSIDIFHLVTSITLVLGQWLWLATYPKPVNTWSAIPDLILSLQELARVYAERKKRVAYGSYIALGLITINFAVQLAGNLRGLCY